MEKRVQRIGVKDRVISLNPCHNQLLNGLPYGTLNEHVLLAGKLTTNHCSYAIDVDLNQSIDIFHLRFTYTHSVIRLD